MEQARAFRVWQNRLRQDVRDWEHSSRDAELLLQGMRLTEAEAQLAQHTEDLTAEELAYIEASRQNRDREQRARDQERRQRESLEEWNHLTQLVGKAPVWAGLIGAATRMVLSWYFGSFLYPLRSGPFIWEFDTFSKPALQGFFGTWVAGIFVIPVLTTLPRDKAAVTLRHVGRFVIAGIAWGFFIFIFVTIGFQDAHKEAIGWYNHRWGYPITGLCWGIGFAIGTYSGDKLGAPSADFSHVLRHRLVGALCGAVGCLLRAPLIMHVLFPELMTQHDLQWRTWGEVMEQSFSALAVLTCFYWQRQKRARLQL